MMLKLPQECRACRDTQATRGTKTLFLKAVSVWINKPHVVNRRLCGSTIELVCRCSTKREAEKALIECQEWLESRKGGAMLSWDSGQSFKDLSKERSPYTVILRELVPKSEFFPHLYEAVVYDKDEASVTCIPLQQSNTEHGVTKELAYSIQFGEIDNDFPAWAQVNELTLSWNCECVQAELPALRSQTSSQWLRSVLLKKLVSWSQVNDISTSATSLQLVAVDKYKDTYVRLKNTYGRDLVKNWPERTDPKKFVYEDVAIATYLLLIWEEDREKKGLKEKQSFVDLGCGNGLLVYILTKEGHKGLGIDLRKRNIWDTFGPGIDLREETIKPSSEHLFPHHDWLIGNHSDELTPWIPVIAARSSPGCNFFVLPCCHHDFVGKFGDAKKGQSRYGTYVDFVKSVVEHCGFLPEIDTLRIPSTKRICLIGRERTYKPENEVMADVRRQAFIDKRSMLTQLKNIKLQGQGSHITPAPRSQGTTMASELSPVDPLKKILFAQHSPIDELSGVQRSNGLNLTRLHSSEDEGYGSYDAITQVHAKKRKVEPQLEIEENPTPSSQCSGIADQTPSLSKGVVKKWAAGFQPRVEQGVRNCQAVSEAIKLKIVNAVFDLVLNSEDGQEKVEMAGGKLWRKGGSGSLSEVAALFDQVTLQELKSECGGLQTLLRNHSHIFQVSGGRVKLRDFSQADPWKGCNPQKRQGNKERREQRDTRKTTLCWFDEHHPDGCPRSAADCLFAHGQQELREKPSYRRDHKLSAPV